MSKLDGNSNASKESREEEKVINPVVKNAKVKKPSEIKKFADNVFAEDAKNVGSEVIKDIVLPKFKDLCVSGLKYIAEFIFYGSRGGGNKSSTNGVRTIQYNSMYDQPQKPQKKMSVYEVNDVTLETRADCEDVLNCLYDILNRYGLVSVADFYDSIGYKSYDFTANDYGWRDLTGAEPVRTYGGRYSIRFPRVQPLK